MKFKAKENVKKAITLTYAWKKMKLQHFLVLINMKDDLLSLNYAYSENEVSL